MKTSSYYLATAHPAPAHPPLRESVEADVCVVGGGIAGLAAATALALAGCSSPPPDYDPPPGALGLVGTGPLAEAVAATLRLAGLPEPVRIGHRADRADPVGRGPEHWSRLGAR